MKKIFAALFITLFALSLATPSYAARQGVRRQSQDQPPKKQSQPARSRPASSAQRGSVAPANKQAKQVARPTNHNSSRPASANKPANSKVKPDNSASTQKTARASAESKNDSTTVRRSVAQTPSTNTTDEYRNKRPSLDISHGRNKRISTPSRTHSAPRPKNNQHTGYSPIYISSRHTNVMHPPTLSAHTSPSRYYSSRPEYTRHNRYIMHNNVIIIRSGYISYVYHPVVYYRPLPIYYRPHYYYRYHSYYSGYNDFYILGRLMLAFANAVERNNQQEQIDRLRDDISYLQHKLELQDGQLTTNNQSEFYKLLSDLGVSQEEIEEYDSEQDYLLQGNE